MHAAFISRPVHCGANNSCTTSSHCQMCVACALPAVQPARLLARSGTCFKHYSIAASPCGNFIAASGNSGLVVLFRVQRSNPSQQQQEGATAAAAATAGNSSASSKGSNSSGSGPAEGPESLAWRIVHEATLLCVNNRETMVNSVRFGQFGGVPRLLVSHQVRAEALSTAVVVCALLQVAPNTAIVVMLARPL